MTYVLLVPFLLICFFILHTLSKNDFVLLRENISLQQIFDSVFICIILSFFAGRAFYIFDTFSFDYFHILKFLHIVRFSGFSFFGFIVGISISLFILFYRKKAMKRIYDIFSLSLFPLLILTGVFSPENGVLMAVKYLYLFLLVIIYGFLLSFHKNYTLKDGSISLILLIGFAIFEIVFPEVASKKILFDFFSIVQVTSLLIVMSAIVALPINQQFRLLKKK